MSVNSLATTSATPDTSSTGAKDRLNSDLDTFLKLFTTQLQNQDPTEPLDTYQMTDQITQFTQVEQQVKTNTNLEKLLATQRQSQLATAVSFIGSEVETTGNTGELYGNSAIFSYNLATAAAQSEVVITDSTGRAVFKGNGPVANGRNLVVWDGKNSFTGQQEPSGTYTITVKAKNAAGQDIASDARAVGIVTAVESGKDGEIMVSIGKRNIKFEDILAVRTPTQAPNS
jgi:flagellar basal-body rod modification protein FlgD